MSRLAGGGHAPSPVWAVIRREFIQRVRSRWFLFATLGVPLLIVGGAVVPIWLTSRSEAAARTVVLIDRSGELGDAVAATLGATGYTVERAAEVEEAEARTRVAEERVGSLLVLDSTALTEARARLVSAESPSALRQLGIRQAVIQAALERQLANTGTSVERVMGGGTLEVETLRGAGRSNALAVMTGPTIARELAAGVLTTALVASEDLPVAQALASRLSTDTLKLRFANDPLGVELWGAFKNVIALACGVCDGLGKDSATGASGAPGAGGTLGGDNLKAAVFAAGFREACHLLSAMGAEHDTALSPAGIGDLYVTATSPHGRNRRTGELLGSGQRLDEALGSTVMVSEGVRATRMFAARAAADGFAAPFVNTVLALLDGAIEPRDCVESLLGGDD